MSKFSVVFCCMVLASTVFADEELVEAKRRCWSSLYTANQETTNKYHGTRWYEFRRDIEDEAYDIYKDGIEAMNTLLVEVNQAKTMEVTMEVETYSGTIIECSVDIALGASKIIHDVFDGLDELYTRVTGWKGRV